MRSRVVQEYNRLSEDPPLLRGHWGGLDAQTHQQFEHADGAGAPPRRGSLVHGDRHAVRRPHPLGCVAAHRLGRGRGGRHAGMADERRARRRIRPGRRADQGRSSGRGTPRSARGVRPGSTGFAARRPDRPGQPQSVPGGAGRAGRHRPGRGSPVRAPVHRYRRPQEGQRHARPCRRRRPAPRRGPDPHQQPSPVGPRLPDRRRRVRRGADRLRTRAGTRDRPADPCLGARCRRRDVRRGCVLGHGRGVLVPAPRGRASAAPPSGRRGPVLGQAPRAHRCPAVRPGPPWRRGRRAKHRGAGPGRFASGVDPGTERCLPAALRAANGRGHRVRGSRPARPRVRLRQCKRPVRGRRGDRAHGRARPGQSRGRAGRCARARRALLPVGQPVAPIARGRGVQPVRGAGDGSPLRHPSRAHRRRAHRARGGRGSRPLARGARLAPPARRAYRGRRCGSRKRRAAPADRGRVRHHEDRPLARPGRRRQRVVGRGPPGTPRPRLATRPDHPGRGRRDTRRSSSS